MPDRSRSALTRLLVGIALHAPVHAEEILVTASRTAPDGVAEVDEASLNRWPNTTVLPALNRLPGVRAFNKGGQSYLSIEGGEPNYALVLLDGVRLNDPGNSQGGAFDFMQLPPAVLSRVAVSSGVLSATQGADALSGVVQMKLREAAPHEQSTTLSTSVDSTGGFGGDATLAVGTGNGGLVFGGGGMDSGGLTEGADLARQYGVLKIDRQLGALKVSTFVLGSQSDRREFAEDSGGPRLAVNRERETRQTDMTVAAIDFSDADATSLKPHLAVRWSAQNAEVMTPAIAPGVLQGVPAIRADTRLERINVLADVLAKPFQSLTFALGAEYSHEAGRNQGAIDFGGWLPANFERSREMASGFAEASFRPGALVGITLGARVDAPNQGPAEWSGRARLELTPLDDGPLLFASVATGFKLPSLYALGYPLIANPMLKPERARSLEAGLEGSGATHWRAAVFEHRYRDLIDFDPVLFTNVNRAQVATRGVQTRIEREFATRWLARGSLGWLDIESATPLRARPRWQGAAEVVWQTSPSLESSLALSFNDEYKDSAIPTGLIRAPGHALLDAGFRWQANPTLALALALRNALAADYEDAVGFPAPGRTLWLSVQLRI